MSERLKSYFRHYRSERRGVIVFLLLVALILIGGELIETHYKPEPEPFKIALIDDEDHRLSEAPPDGEAEPIPFQFNPNTLSDSGYLELGFTEREIEILRNYQKAGGRFRVKSDFARLFFVDSSEYARLYPFLDLPEHLPKRSKPETGDRNFPGNQIAWSDTTDTTAFRYTPFTCDLNTADTIELKRLKGIGSFYAREIVTYREELGGFHSLGQLMEIWKMTPERIDGFADHVTIDSSAIRKLNINRSSAHALSRHPYLSFGLANKIVLKREEISGFEGPDQLCASGLLDAELCRKLVPYLIFEK
jgi:hypothetical protein